MKIFAYASKSDERIDAPLAFVVAPTIEAAQELVEKHFYKGEWTDFFKRFHHLTEYNPVKANIWIVEQEAQYNVNTGQGIDGIGFAAIDNRGRK